MSSPDIDDIAQMAATESRRVRRDLRQTMLSGVALTVPFLITLLVLGWALDTLSAALTPLADALVVVGVAEGMHAVLVEALALAGVVGLTFAVGFVSQHGPETNLGSRIDVLVGDIPGIGSIYTGVERMSEVLLEGDTESFREVKLVEFPREGSYALAFLTADAPPAVEDAAGREEMLTVFVPMAPNPVMGGHLLNLPPERIHDVDLTVEEGIEAVMTTGLAIDESARTGTA